jgi:uncharacterized membrane protein HdeD (DUF308 family)
VPKASATRHQARRAPGRQGATASTASVRTLGTVGERPPGVFGGLPISELAILAGLIALVVGSVDSGGSAVDVGIVLMALGVTEVTAREHLSGYRSHTTLLAFMPAVIVEAIYALVIGAPRQRILLLAPVIPVFVICYWLLRRHFRVARHARLVKHN